MQKGSVFANVWISKNSDRIMSWKLWGKVTGEKMLILCKKQKIKILGELWTFLLSVHYYWKWLCLQNMLIFLEKCDFLYEGFYILTKS